jgi:hypothetical protein
MSVFSNKQDLESKIKSLEAQQDEINKHWHICKAVQLANVIDENMKDGLFEKHNIHRIEISAYIDRDEDIPLSFYYNLINYKEQEVQSIPKLTGVSSKLSKAFFNFRIHNINYMNKFFSSGHVTHPFVIEEGLKDKILNELLSPELKKIMNYMELHSELPENESSTRKLKL